ncbi:MAG TPA: ABC transporter permease [Chitinophagaceae bacterium]|nr:ABC transporter permease [Chitinophagaceae bacterium]
MLYYNLRLALRNLFRHKTFSFLNIIGLSIGLASCIMIGLYAFNELSFDKFNNHHTQIYRINKVTNEKGKEGYKDAITPGALADELPKQIAEVASATRFRPWFTEMLVSYDSIHIKLDDVVYTDASFLQMFDFPVKEGDRKTALAEPNTAVITESTARKYFKNEDPLGKTLLTLNNIPVKITAIAEDVPSHSSLQFTMLISWGTVAANKDYFFWMNNQTTNVVYSFVRLKENSNAEKVGDKISALEHKYRDETEFAYRIFLQPLDDIHLRSSDVQYAEQFHTNSNKIVYTLLIIAAFILLIGCFNFINLTTAGALGRAKETGVQKVLGANQWQLVRKFFGESFLLCFISLAIAVFFVITILPFFNQLTNVNLQTSMLLQWNVVLSLSALLITISFIAGLYPAIFLSRFKSTDVFRNVILAGKNNWLRQAMVTTQFAMSILLIIATIIVNRQTTFLVSKDLGFNRDRVAVIQLANTNVDMKHRSATFISALKQNAGVVSVSASNRVPGQSFNGYGIVPEGHTLDEHLLANVLETDADFASTYTIKLAQGRFFDPKLVTDTANSIVINEAMAQYLGWKDPVGKKLEIYEARKGSVIGVMKDFNFASLREKIQPLAIILNDNPLYVSIKLKAGATQTTLSAIQRQWKQFDDEFPFDYFFMDEELNKLYRSDQRLLKVISIFATLAIIIACIGLFGLSIYTAKRRTKEIGIRKVLGASVTGIVGLLSKEFVKLVSIAILIASPIAWWAANKWLQDFAYRINIGWWVFALAGVIALLIAMLTVSFRAIKAAVANPVKSLRTE